MSGQPNGTANVAIIKGVTGAGLTSGGGGGRVGGRQGCGTGGGGEGRGCRGRGGQRAAVRWRGGGGDGVRGRLSPRSPGGQGPVAAPALWRSG